MIRHLISGAKGSAVLAASQVLSVTRWSSQLFFLVFSSGFGRETRAVLLGQLEYRKRRAFDGDSNFLLRRNIHRLEKGICMPNRRDTFATKYISETLSIYSRCLSSSHDSSEMQWAHDVLEKYTNICSTSKHPVVIESIKRFSLLQAPGPYAGKVPFEHQSRQSPKIKPISFAELCSHRSSTRWFTSEAVPKEVIDKAIATALSAPSACNRQPYRFIVIQGESCSRKVARLAMGTAGFDNQIPCLIVTIGLLNGYPYHRDRHAIYIDASLALMQLMLYLETAGYASCPINWPDIEEREVKLARLLKLRPWERPVLLTAVGRPQLDGLVPFSQKKSTKACIEWITEL